MIIDAHYHVLKEEWIPDFWWKRVCEIYQIIFKAKGVQMTVEEIRQNILDSLFDPDGAKLIAQMDEAGIDMAVILPQDFGLAGGGDAKVPIEEQNRAYADLQKQHPDRIIAFATIDPRRIGAVEIVEEAISDWGLRGLKLHPGAGFSPDGKETYNLLAKVNELGVPLLTHTGVFFLRSRTCDPLLLDDILVDFPHLTVIAAHLGHGWEDNLNAFAGWRFNLMADISARQIIAQQNYGEFCRILRHALDGFGHQRILFGTDGPLVNPIMEAKEYIKLIKELPENAPQGISFSDEEVNAMLGKNAYSLFCS